MSTAKQRRKRYTRFEINETDDHELVLRKKLGSELSRFGGTIASLGNWFQSLSEVFPYSLPGREDLFDDTHDEDVDLHQVADALLQEADYIHNELQQFMIVLRDCETYKKNISNIVINKDE
jgi:hypothetical protein